MEGTPATRSTSPGYLAVAELAALVREQQRRPRGRVSEQLAAALLKIAGGVWDRYRLTPDRDDFSQDAVLHLIGRPLRKADPRRNLFAYFTTCCIRFGLKQRDAAAAERRRWETYAGDVVESGKRVPGRE